VGQTIGVVITGLLRPGRGPLSGARPGLG